MSARRKIRNGITQPPRTSLAFNIKAITVHPIYGQYCCQMVLLHYSTPRLFFRFDDDLPSSLGLMQGYMGDCTRVSSTSWFEN